MEVNGTKQLFSSNRSSKYLPLCSAEERNSYCHVPVLSCIAHGCFVGPSRYLISVELFHLSPLELFPF